MKTSKRLAARALLSLAALTTTGHTLAQNALGCAWPLTISPSGSGNVLAPDDMARYWMMPFPADRTTMTIRGDFPHARYFSFVAYDTDSAGRPVGAAGRLNDSMIIPDQGTTSPPSAVRGKGRAARGAASPAGSYTLTISRDPVVAAQDNGIQVSPNEAWVALRIYVPAPDAALSGHAVSGSVPLPTIAFDGDAPLASCPPPSSNDGNPYHPVRSANRLEDMRAFLGLLFPPGFDIRQPVDYDNVAEGRLWFAPPREPPPLLLPNPDNKYILMTPGPYQPGRVIVLRARAPLAAGTGAGATVPPGRAGREELRYWSVCNNDFALPLSTVQCLSDFATDVQGQHFTLVISDDLRRPDWLRPGVNWLPWGDPQYPKLIFFRHMLPSPDFSGAVQQVVAGCPDACVHPDAVFEFTLPDLPSRSVFAQAGPRVQSLMGEHYPVAAWCDKSAFERGGWRACLP
jgi:hypothetical protein